MRQTMKENYVLITGATGGLGNAFCRQFANSGYNLFLTATNTNRLNLLKEDLLKEYPQIEIEVFACDLSNTQSICNLTDYIAENKFMLSFIVSNAGYITEGSIKNASTETLLKCIDVNCKGSVQLIKTLVDNKNYNKLNIICVASMAANYPMPYMAIYASTKSFLKNFMLAMRHEYKKEGVNILVVEPGAIATSKEMKEAIKAQGLKGKLSSVAPEKIAYKSYKKSCKNKARYVPGFFNKLTLFFSALLPSSIKMKVISGMWRKSQQKRNIH